MTSLGRRVRAEILLRSFAIQGSWNYRTLLGAGFAFALLPALRRIYRGRRAELSEAVRRHCEVFNSHPYLTPMALGAVAVLEAEGEDPELIGRFKTALRGSLGSLGDRLVWTAWRPVCLVGALILLLLGAPWWLVVAGFLVLYNAGHLGLRIWGLRSALRDGRNVAKRLQRVRFGPVQQWMETAGAFGIGLVLPLAISGRLVDSGLSPVWMAAGAIGAVLGISFDTRIRTPVIACVTVFAVLGLFVRVTA